MCKRAKLSLMQVFVSLYLLSSLYPKRAVTLSQGRPVYSLFNSFDLKNHYHLIFGKQQSFDEGMCLSRIFSHQVNKTAGHKLTPKITQHIITP